MSEQDPQEASEGGIGQSESTGGLGAAVIVRGQIMAWFAEFTEEAREWCTENYFGEWLVWRARPPEIVPLTEAEYAEVQREAAEIVAALNPLPEAPNVELRGAEQASLAERPSRTQGSASLEEK